MRLLSASGSIRLLQELFAHRPIFLQGLLSLGSIRHDAFLAALAADAQNALFLLHIYQIKARKFTDAQARSVKEFQHGSVAPKEQTFSGSYRTALPGWRIRAGLMRMQPFPLSRAAAAYISFRPAQLIEEAIHFFCGKHRRDALRQLRRGNKTRGVFLQQFLSHAILEE